MIVAIRGLGAAVAAAVLAGCAAVGQADFSCNGMPGNVTCLDAITVYELTSDPALDAAVRAEVARLTEAGETGIDTQALVARIKQQRAYIPTGSTTLMAPLTQPLPVLEPGYLFSEITPRRWSFGEAEVAGTRVLTPMQVERDTPAAPPATRAPAATSATPSAQGR